jgi:hypothetical protein
VSFRYLSLLFCFRTLYKPTIFKRADISTSCSNICSPPRLSSATIELPSSLHSVGKQVLLCSGARLSFTYQLTPIGDPMPALHVSSQVPGDLVPCAFSVAGAEPNALVSWTLFVRVGVPTIMMADGQGASTTPRRHSARPSPSPAKKRPAAGSSRHTRSTPAAPSETEEESETEKEPPAARSRRPTRRAPAAARRRSVAAAAPASPRRSSTRIALRKSARFN